MSDELLKYLDMRIALCKEDNHDHVGFRLDEIERLRAELEKKRDLLGKANALARIRLDRVAELTAERDALAAQVAAAEGYVAVNISIIDERWLNAAKREADIARRICADDDVVLCAAIHGYLLAAAQQVQP